MPVEEAATAKKVKVATWSALEDRTPTYARVLDVDLVIIRHDDKVSRTSVITERSRQWEYRSPSFLDGPTFRS